MPRLLSTALVLVLLGGTAAAFAVTEGLKLEKTPISGTRVGKTFSPTCGCPTRLVHIAFRLRKADTVRLEVVDAGGSVVRTLVQGRRFSRGLHHFTWNGRSDAGGVLPGGVYQPRVHLVDAHRTIVLPNPIQLDTKAPVVRLAYVRPRVFSPDGDGRADRIQVGYRVSEPARGLLLVNGKLRVRTRWWKQRWTLEWFGRVRGRPLPAGTYRLSLAAVDVAGNRSKPVGIGTVRIRYVTLGPGVVRARAGARFRVVVSTDARSYRWRLAGRSGTARGRVLEVRAPRRPGRYVLYVFAGTHGARARVIVGKGR